MAFVIQAALFILESPIHPVRGTGATSWALPLPRPTCACRLSVAWEQALQPQTPGKMGESEVQKLQKYQYS